MIKSGFRVLCEADKGQNIYDFANEVILHRKKLVYDIIAVFNDVYIEVTPETTIEDIIKYYFTKTQN